MEQSKPCKHCSPSWARLIARVYQVDPLVCTRCGQRMSLIAFVTDQMAIGKILDHVGLSTPEADKPPPPVPEVLRVAEHGDGWGPRHTGTRPETNASTASSAQKWTPRHAVPPRERGRWRSETAHAFPGAPAHLSVESVVLAAPEARSPVALADRQDYRFTCQKPVRMAALESPSEPQNPARLERGPPPPTESTCRHRRDAASQPRLQGGGGRRRGVGGGGHPPDRGDRRRAREARLLAAGPS